MEQQDALKRATPEAQSEILPTTEPQQQQQDQN